MCYPRLASPRHIAKHRRTEAFCAMVKAAERWVLRGSKFKSEPASGRQTTTTPLRGQGDTRRHQDDGLTGQSHGQSDSTSDEKQLQAIHVERKIVNIHIYGDVDFYPQFGRS